MFMEPCYGDQCQYIPPQYAPTYQPSPPIYPPPVYNPMSHYNPLQYTYQPATALGQAPYSPRLAGGLLAGDAVVVDREVAFVWENRPTKAGIYRFTMQVKIPCAKGQTQQGILTCLPKENTPQFPFENPVYAGAFVQNMGDGQAQLLLGEAIEKSVNDGSVSWGTNAGEVSFVNRPYIYFEEQAGQHYIKGLFAYILLTEDLIREGLDPATTTAYYNKSGVLIYEQDAQGSVWHNPELQGTTGLPPVIAGIGLAKLAMWAAGVLGILAYFGLLGGTPQRAVTTLVNPVKEKVVEVINKGIQIGGDFLRAAAPWLVGGVVGYLLLKDVIGRVFGRFGM